MFDNSNNFSGKPVRLSATSFVNLDIETWVERFFMIPILRLGVHTVRERREIRKNQIPYMENITYGSPLNIYGQL